MASRHRFDPTAFVFGVLFVTLAGVGMLDSTLLRSVNFAQLIPAVLVIAGVTLLVSTMRQRGHDDADDTTVQLQL